MRRRRCGRCSTARSPESWPSGLSTRSAPSPSGESSRRSITVKRRRSRVRRLRRWRASMPLPATRSHGSPRRGRSGRSNCPCRVAALSVWPSIPLIRRPCTPAYARAGCAAASTAAEPGSTVVCPSRACSPSRSAQRTGRCTPAPSRVGCSGVTIKARAGPSWRRCSSCPRDRTGASRRGRGPRTCAGSPLARAMPTCCWLGSSSAA